MSSSHKGQWLRVILDNRHRSQLFLLLEEYCTHDQGVELLIACSWFLSEMGRFRFRNRNWNRNWHFFHVGGIGIGIESTRNLTTVSGIGIKCAGIVPSLVSMNLVKTPPLQKLSVLDVSQSVPWDHLSRQRSIMAKIEYLMESLNV